MPGALAAGPLLADDRLFVATQGREGAVTALRLADGKALWRRQVGDMVASPALDDGTVYAATSEGWVAALDASTGRQRWRVRVPGAVRVAPVPVAAGIVVATTLDSLFLLESFTGRVALRRATSGTVLAAPAVAGGMIVFGTSTGALAAADTGSLATLWQHDLGSSVVGTVAVRGGVAHALTARGVLWSVPLDSALAPRHVELGITARAGPLPAVGGVYLAAVNGRLMRIGDGGAEEWSIQVRSPVVEPPVQDGRMLFVVSQRGEVVAFR